MANLGIDCGIFVDKISRYENRPTAKAAGGAARVRRENTAHGSGKGVGVGGGGHRRNKADYVVEEDDSGRGQAPRREAR
jgi:hypothetical protein